MVLPCTGNRVFLVGVVIVYLMAWASEFVIGRLLSVCYLEIKCDGFVVSEFQPRGLLHEHQIYAPELDPRHDMHIHYHL